MFSPAWKRGLTTQYGPAALAPSPASGSFASTLTWISAPSRSCSARYASTSARWRRYSTASPLTVVGAGSSCRHDTESAQALRRRRSPPNRWQTSGRHPGPNVSRSNAGHVAAGPQTRARPTPTGSAATSKRPRGRRLALHRPAGSPSTHTLGQNLGPDHAGVAADVRVERWLARPGPVRGVDAPAALCRATCRRRLAQVAATAASPATTADHGQLQQIRA